MILEILYFFIPAYIANMTPVFVRKINFLGVPVDQGLKYKGKRLFGKNKTVRGLVFGIAAGLLAFVIQQQAYMNGFTSYALIDYSTAGLWLGITIGVGALGGDLVESFFKRQSGHPPGKPLIPFDQLDFMLGAYLVTIPLWLAYWPSAVAVLLIVLILDLGVQRVGYLLKLKDDPF